MWKVELGWNEVIVNNETIAGEECVRSAWLTSGPCIFGRRTVDRRNVRRSDLMPDGSPRSIVGWDDQKRGSQGAEKLSRQCFSLSVFKIRTEPENNSQPTSSVLLRKIGSNTLVVERSGKTLLNNESVELEDGDKVSVSKVLFFVVKFKPLKLYLSSEISQPILASILKSTQRFSEAALGNIQIEERVTAETTYLVSPMVPLRLTASIVAALSFGIPIVTASCLIESTLRVERGNLTCLLDLDSCHPDASVLQQEYGNRFARYHAAALDMKCVDVLPKDNYPESAEQAFIVDLDFRKSRCNMFLGKRIIFVDEASKHQYFALLPVLGASEVLDLSDTQAQDEWVADHKEKLLSSDDGLEGWVVVYEHYMKPPRPCWDGFIGLDSINIMRAICSNLPVDQVPCRVISSPINQVCNTPICETKQEISDKQTFVSMPKPTTQHDVSTPPPTTQHDVSRETNEPDSEERVHQPLADDTYENITGYAVVCEEDPLEHRKAINNNQFPKGIQRVNAGHCENSLDSTTVPKGRRSLSQNSPFSGQRNEEVRNGAEDLTDVKRTTNITPMQPKSEADFGKFPPTSVECGSIVFKPRKSGLKEATAENIKTSSALLSGSHPHNNSQNESKSIQQRLSDSTMHWKTMCRYIDEEDKTSLRCALEGIAKKRKAETKSNPPDAFFPVINGKTRKRFAKGRRLLPIP